MPHQRINIEKILIFLHPIHNQNWRDVSTIYIYITRLASNELSSQSNRIIIILLIPLPILLYKLPTVTNNKEINVHEAIMENETKITKTVIYNQIIGTITTLFT
jgi:hypothetical protein